MQRAKHVTGVRIMKESVYIVFGILSLFVLIATGCLTIKAYKGKNRGKRVLTSLHIFTLGVFISTVLIFVPVYYVSYDFGDSYTLLRPFLISIHHAFRVFILDGEFDIIRDSVSGFWNLLHILFSLYAGILYVLAPILTFSNVLSLFKNVKNEIRFSWHKKRPYYIFSELNERSITLAESIIKDKDIKNNKPIIVFTDVFEQNKESNYEILLKAHDLNAILLKNDIVRLNVKNKKSRAEFFLIGEDESENVEQAIKLTQEYKNECQYRPISIFVYSNKPSAGYIIDSIDKGLYTLDKSLTASIEDNPRTFLKEKLYSSKTIDSGFYVRRIDSIEALAQQILKQDRVIDTIFNDNQDKIISVTILGMGSYGKEFLKYALSLFQILGYKVEINVFDAPLTENGVKKELIKKLGHEWPDIIDDSNSKSFVRNEVGDSSYDIRFFDNVDCFSSDFDRLFAQENCFRDRLKRTQIAIVSLGDDDKNIDAAVMLRSLFDMVNPAINSKSGSRVKPVIFSVVYDDKKTSNLNCNQDGCGIVNYRGESIQIDFIGNLSYQYSYDRIKEKKALEDKALRYHLDWLRRDATNKKLDKKSDLDELVDSVTKSTRAYMDYEYYRNSSIARAVHEELLECAKNYVKLHRVDEHPEKCLCDICAMSSITEHMRWNVYMRTLGYRYSPNRNDRAKTHNLLVSWGDLPELDKYKDINESNI